MSGEPEREGMAEALRRALADMGEVFGDIVSTAEEKASLRCPYMNVERRCTAAFSCINQVWGKPGTRAICSGQHKIDFSRWGAAPEEPAGDEGRP